jgi:Ion transport protein
MHKDSYLRCGWNIIDVVVIISGYVKQSLIIRLLELIFSSIKLKALRVVRVFRPLRTVTLVPSKPPWHNNDIDMRKLILALISSLPEFANVGKASSLNAANRNLPRVRFRSVCHLGSAPIQR